MLIQNTIAGYETGAVTMVKNTPTATTATVQTTVVRDDCGDRHPGDGPHGSWQAAMTHARRVDSPADPAMTTNAVQATTRLCSFPTDLGDQPGQLPAAMTACIARAIVGERVVTAGGEPMSG